MTTDYKKLCAELADELSQFNAWYIEDNGYGLPKLEALLQRCDAALADEPASVIGQPSDEAWDALVERAWDKYQTVGYQGERFMYDRDFDNALEFVRQGLARWGNPAPQPPAEPFVPTVMEIIELSSEIEAAGLGQVDFARAVLARWGNPTTH